jgi:hypothetical protein
LQAAKPRYPGLVRIAFQANRRKASVRSAGLAHQFLEKPLDYQTMHAIMARSCALRESRADEPLRRVVVDLRNLPSLPSIYRELMEEIHSRDASLVLATNKPAEYRRVLDMQLQRHLADWQAELEVFGTTHAEVGAHLLNLGRLEESIVEAVAFHHRPSACATAEFTHSPPCMSPVRCTNSRKRMKKRSPHSKSRENSSPRPACTNACPSGVKSAKRRKAGRTGLLTPTMASSFHWTGAFALAGANVV